MERARQSNGERSRWSERGKESAGKKKEGGGREKERNMERKEGAGTNQHWTRGSKTGKRRDERIDSLQSWRGVRCCFCYSRYCCRCCCRCCLTADTRALTQSRGLPLFLSMHRLGQNDELFADDAYTLWLIWMFSVQQTRIKVSYEIIVEQIL